MYIAIRLIKLVSRQGVKTVMLNETELANFIPA